MSVIEFEDAPRPRIYARNVLANCPECDGDFTVRGAPAGGVIGNPDANLLSAA